jgi:hypothetical protein
MLFPARLIRRGLIVRSGVSSDLKAAIEYRIAEEHARSVFRPEEGRVVSGAVRLVRLDADDPRVDELARIYSQHRGRGFYGWKLHHRSTPSEIRDAKLQLFQIKTGILPTGEECGTVYDDRDMCPLCGVGRVQESALRLRLTNAPKRSEIARTWGGEMIIAARVVRLLIDAGTAGWGLGPVQRSKRGQEEPFTLSETEPGRRLLSDAAAASIQYPSSAFYRWANEAAQRATFDEAVKEHESRKSPRRRLPGGTSSDWYQFFITSKPVDLSPVTRFGH